MNISWQYPLILIRHGGGYASVVVDAEESSVCDQSIVIFTGEAAAFEFMERTQLVGQLSELKNAREFQLLLQCLKPPVRHIVLDPCPVERELNAAWSGPIAQVIDELVIDYSPWNYPAFVIALESGYASIEAETSVVALVLFTSEQKADAYRNEASLPGEIMPVAKVTAARSLWCGLSDMARAVAIDPQIEEGVHSAKYCLSISTLLERYLV